VYNWLVGFDKMEYQLRLFIWQPLKSCNRWC